MKHYKLFAMLFACFALSAFTSCSQYEEYFPTELDPTMDTKATDATSNTDTSDSTDSTDSSDSSDNDDIPIIIIDPEVENIDYTITIP